MADSPVTINSPGAEPEAPAGPSPQEQKQMEQAYAQMKRKMSMEEIGRKIKHKIMVLSGKGGVGKSTVSTGLALSLAQQGHKVGILDIDITGPNVPKMMGLDGRRLHVENKRIHPAQGHLGVKVISMAFLLEDEDTPVVWRGPIKLGAIQQFIGDVEWGELDYLVIDFPPGTSDEPLTVAQSLPDINGMVIVTTPQQVALLDSRKSITFSESLKVPVLGVVENMSGFTVRGTASPGTDLSIAAPGGKNTDQPRPTTNGQLLCNLRHLQRRRRQRHRRRIWRSLPWSSCPLTLVLYGEVMMASTVLFLSQMGLPPLPLPKWLPQSKTNCRMAQIAALRSFEVAS